ncbi:MAG: helix-turn-helix domain-containing protein [Rhodospirillales bacterium]|nr:helix-turn-helix domain-containing protein [Rhodospirillales bacterium]
MATKLAPLKGKPKSPGKAGTVSGLVQSLTRALTLLEVMAEDEDGFRLTDLAHQVGLPLSTTHRLLTTLEQSRFAQFDREANMWHVGAKCLAVGAVFLRRRNFAIQSVPFMQRLRDESGETVNLGVEDQGEVVFLNQMESREVMRAITQPGGRVPMHCSGLGKALLAAMPESEVSALLSKRGLSRMTARSIVWPTKLRKSLLEARKRGYAIDDEEYAIGLRCVAAVIADEHGDPLAGISVSGPKARITDERLPKLGELVWSVARDITLALGGRPPKREA